MSVCVTGSTDTSYFLYTLHNFIRAVKEYFDVQRNNICYINFDCKLKNAQVCDRQQKNKCWKVEKAFTIFKLGSISRWQ